MALPPLQLLATPPSLLHDGRLYVQVSIDQRCQQQIHARGDFNQKFLEVLPDDDLCPNDLSNS